MEGSFLYTNRNINVREAQIWSHRKLGRSDATDTPNIYLFFVYMLPFPSLPYPRDEGTVSFLRSPLHMSCRPLSQPLSASRIPRVNHTGFLSPSLRLSRVRKIHHSLFDKDVQYSDKEVQDTQNCYDRICTM